MEEEKNILGIGIASIGPVDIRNGIILNPPRFYGVKHVPIKEAIQKKYNLPVYFDHDNNCAALAEKLFGIARRNRISFFLLYPMALVPALYVEERFSQSQRI